MAQRKRDKIRTQELSTNSIRIGGEFDRFPRLLRENIQTRGSLQEKWTRRLTQETVIDLLHPSEEGIEELDHKRKDEPKQPSMRRAERSAEPLEARGSYGRFRIRINSNAARCLVTAKTDFDRGSTENGIKLLAKTMDILLKTHLQISEEQHGFLNPREHVAFFGLMTSLIIQATSNTKTKELKESKLISAAIDDSKRMNTHASRLSQLITERGVQLFEESSVEDAKRLLRIALWLDRLNSEAAFQIANIYRRQSLRRLAERSLEYVVNIDDRDERAFNILGNLKMERGDTRAAISDLRKALEINKRNGMIHYNLGNALDSIGNQIDAVASYKKALSLRRDYPEACNNLGNTLVYIGKVDEGIRYLEKAIRTKPDYAEARKNLGMAQMLIGNYQDGWQNYEYRFESEADIGILCCIPRSKRARTIGDLFNAEVMIVCEQGLGDTFQFIRYVRTLHVLGISTVVCAPEKLHGIIVDSGFCLAPLTPEEGSRVKEGVWIPLMSLAGILKVEPSCPGRITPYIGKNVFFHDKWNKVCSSDIQSTVVGIHWQGNPLHEQTNSRGRSIPLESFRALSEIDGIKLVSLQKGYGSEQLERCSFREIFVEWQNQVDETMDFRDIVAIMNQCRLVITNDSGIAHLSAGSGKETWLLLKEVPEWRWGLEGNKTCWYPTMKVFRKYALEDWEDLMQRVKHTFVSSIRSDN